MTSLFLDTHLNDILVFILKDGKVVDKREVINKKNNSEYMFPVIKELLDTTKIDEIIVVNGPGSFTSVRLGVTIAKTLAYTLKIPIKTITSLEILAISSENLNVGISDGNGYYLATFDNSYQPINEYTYVNNSEFINMDNKDEYYLEYKIDASKVYSFLKNKASINAHSVNPLYIKKIGVEIDKKSN
jgi:tRNA threonylcarbamoyl adenosine modification protein YeaZ